VVDQRIKETYVNDSKATLKTQLYDAYVRFFRWAIDRLQGRVGIVCFVSNNSVIDQIAFDGMRKHLLRDFTQIYHLDLHGNVRKNPKLSGTTHNVFGIQVGVGITIAIRNSQHTRGTVYYYRVPEFWRKTEKLAFLREKGNLTSINWIELQPNEKDIWITEGLRAEFSTFLPVGVKESKLVQSQIADIPTIFNAYSGGVKTDRDIWTYDFNPNMLRVKMMRFINTYNMDVDRWKRRGSGIVSVDDFVTYDDKRIKWSEHLKKQLMSGRYASYSEINIRLCLYRPFAKQYLYFDAIVNDRRLLQYLFFPNSIIDSENVVICVTGIGADYQSFLAANTIVDIKIGISGNSTIQSFPFYTYNEDGTHRRENITDWALAQFQAKYGSEVTKWDIFHFVYAMLHHPQYRERYAENLKRDLPHIPLLHKKLSFLTCVRIGKQLMQIHLNYEQAKEYPLKWLENKDVPFSWRVEKMRLTTDRTAVIVNESLTLSGIPQDCYLYRLDNRSALDWVIDQYQVNVDKRSGIVSDPNNLDDEEYIVRLVGKVITVSVETVRLVNELAQAN
jgi:predicted helicase